MSLSNQGAYVTPFDGLRLSGDTLSSYGNRMLSRGLLPDTLVYGLQQVLKLGEDVGVGLVAVLGHQLAVDAYVELTVGAGDELERAYVVAYPAEGFACHPGSSQCVPSIMAVEYLYLQFSIPLSHLHPPFRPNAGRTRFYQTV